MGVVYLKKKTNKTSFDTKIQNIESYQLVFIYINIYVKWSTLLDKYDFYHIYLFKK